MLVQFFVIDVRNEHPVVIEKMYFLLVAHRDVRVPAQEVMQRCCSGFLRARQNEIEPFDFAPSTSKHCSKFTSGTLQGKLSASPANLSHLRLRSMVRPCRKYFGCFPSLTFSVSLS